MPPLHQLGQVGGRAGTVPEVQYLLSVEGVDEAERIIDVHHPFAEVVAVVALLQPLPHLLLGAARRRRHVAHRLRKEAPYLLLRYPAQLVVGGIHADVLRLVEAAEHRYLRELRHPCQQHEPQVSVRRLEGGVERLQHLAVLLLHRRAQHVEDGLVVLVHQHHRLATRLLVRLAEHVLEADSQVLLQLVATVLLLPLSHTAVENCPELALPVEVADGKVNPEHRVLRPLRLQLRHPQSGKQFPASAEVGLQRAYKQALPEPPRAGEEAHVLLGEAIDPLRLIDIDIAALPYLLKSLYSYRIPHSAKQFAQITP